MTKEDVIVLCESMISSLEDIRAQLVNEGDIK
jgi:hypothetical protein